MLFPLFQIVVLLFSVIIHEVAHGYVAEWLGDSTARIAGRLTLNPVAHLDVFGSFILPLILIITGSPIVIGWAKPVPYNPLALWRDRKYGPLKVALAGPAVNIVIALVMGLALRFAMPYLPEMVAGLIGFVVFLNLLLALFNLIPIPPLDGSKLLTVFLPPRQSLAFQSIGFIGIFFVFLFLSFFRGALFSAVASVFRLIAGEGAWLAFMQLT